MKMIYKIITSVLKYYDTKIKRIKYKKILLHFILFINRLPSCETAEHGTHTSSLFFFLVKWDPSKLHCRPKRLQVLPKKLINK